MNTSRLTVVLLISLATAGFGAGLSVAASPDAKHKMAHHQARKTVIPPRIIGYSGPARTSSADAAAKPGLNLTPSDNRYAEVQDRPFAGRTIHYDDTPSGIPANVTTVGLVKTF